jgi:hypothetical protein
MVDTGWQGLRYGFKWWLQPIKDGKEYVWHAIGFGGQRLIVFPSTGLIATFTGWDIVEDIPFDTELAECLMPAVRSASCSDSTP